MPVHPYIYEPEIEKTAKEVQKEFDDLKEKVLYSYNKTNDRIWELRYELQKYKNLVETMGKKLEEKKDYPSENAMMKLHTSKNSHIDNLYIAFKEVVDRNILGDFLRQYDIERRKENDV